MLEIKILGTGCKRCESLEKMTRKAVEEMKLIFSGEVPRMSELKSLFYRISLEA